MRSEPPSSSSATRGGPFLRRPVRTRCRAAAARSRRSRGAGSSKRTLAPLRRLTRRRLRPAGRKRVARTWPGARRFPRSRSTARGTATAWRTPPHRMFPIAGWSASRAATIPHARPRATARRRRASLQGRAPCGLLRRRCCGHRRTRRGRAGRTPRWRRRACGARWMRKGIWRYRCAWRLLLVRLASLRGRRIPHKKKTYVRN